MKPRGATAQKQTKHKNPRVFLYPWPCTTFCLTAPHALVAMTRIRKGADVVEMLRSEGRNLREDSHCIQPAAGNPSAAARAKWRAKKQRSAAAQKGDDSPGGEGRREGGRVLELLAIYAYEQKHCYVCRSVDPSVSGMECASGSPQSKGAITIHCGVCRSRSWAYPDFPAECPQCANKLQRFALS